MDENDIGREVVDFPLEPPGLGRFYPGGLTAEARRLQEEQRESCGQKSRLNKVNHGMVGNHYGNENKWFTPSRF